MKMKAIMKSRPSAGAELVTVPVPQIGPNELLVKVKVTSICGTDAHIYAWDSWAQSRIKPPLVFGHEFAGEVVEVGSFVKGFKQGDFISAESHIPCGYCYQCRNDQQHICGNLKILGVDTAGCFADYVVLPEVCAWKNDKSMKPEIASVQEPLGNAVYTVLGEDEDVAGQNVAVFGCGPAGLFAVGVSKAASAGKVIHIIKHDFRRTISQQMGSDLIIAYNDPQLKDKIIQATNGVGVDVVLEMTGNQKAISDGIDILRKGGRFSAFGIASEPLINLNLNAMVFKGARIICINGRLMYRTWYQMAGLLNSGRLNPAPVITHKFKLEEFEKAFAQMKSSDRQSAKIVMFP
ncbi:MAG: L-threonine 3-dehydrogenase [Planctomycetota bacterium]|nr:L-threonine 3-dehydrogenase [Planctomycetota bacterium]MDI6788543.1 L-threonine 3-dehydrogenase [Planctomycetota bacterium]